eukprot:762478-Hanusia_phi.AAC.16
MINVNIKSGKAILLIDCSYYIFYRYYATLRWFKFRNVEIDTSTLGEEFLASFEKHFKSDMDKLRKKWKTTLDNMYMCMDCDRCNIWRNSIFTEYKGSRQHATDFNREIFHIFKNKINDIITAISCDKLEADDIVALMKMKIIRSKSGNAHVVIITNDNDYLQLVDDNTTIVNMQMKDLTTRCHNGTENELFIKALLGDKADNIPKAMVGINKKKAIEVSTLSNEKRIEWIHTHGGTEQFEHNMQLISFDNIPKELSDNLMNNINVIA